METSPVTCRTLEEFYHIDGHTFEKQYKEVLSGYRRWDQLSHADEWMLFPENIGPHLAIDETSLSNGELYTFVTNRDACTRECSLVAVVAGTKSEDVVAVLQRIDEKSRYAVKEVTLDLSDSMRKIVRTAFPKANRVIDRFHIQKLACDAVQELRIKHRWDAIQQANEEMEEAKQKNEDYVPYRYSNGDTRRELLIRSRYLLFKSADKWTERQKQRAAILFEEYPDIKKAYGLCHSLRMIFSKNTIKDAARLAMARWYNKVEEAGMHSFNIIAATFYEHYDEILNFYNHRSSNAMAESFNAKIKLFRANLRGVADKKFFLFRIAKLYAYPHQKSTEPQSHRVVGKRKICRTACTAPHPLRLYLCGLSSHRHCGRYTDYRESDRPYPLCGSCRFTGTLHAFRTGKYLSRKAFQESCHDSEWNRTYPRSLQLPLRLSLRFLLS